MSIKYTKYLSILFSVLFPVYALAIDTGLDTAGSGAGLSKGAGGSAGLAVMAGSIIGYLLAFVGVIFLLLIIYGGVLWMIAQGDKNKITKAKDLMVNAVVGLIIILAAYAITYFVVSSVSTSTGGEALPQPETTAK